MKIKGWALDYFNTGEWQVVDERLKDLEKINRPMGRDGYCPGRHNLFAALRHIASDGVRCAIIGQDPYPNTAFATGMAFSVPSDVQSRTYPPTLFNFLREYSSDLGYDLPRNGDLSRWCTQGVLLWNAIPSCRSGQSLSHDWDEYSYLTREIIQVLSQRGIVFALLGQVARRYINDIDPINNSIIVTSHPSPRGSLNSKTPFLGSRLFSTINDKLVSNGQEPVDWRLT